VKDGGLFHLRFRTAVSQAPPLTHPGLASDLIAAAKRYHVLGHWWCKLFLVMPDHIHAMLAFPRAPGMSATVGGWKRGVARFQGVQWQKNYFDHRVRNERESRETWEYICRNPVVKGLCAGEDDWRWRWSPSLEEHESRFAGGAPWGMRYKDAP
jgi:REP element-mobilizing transposase RayT